MEKNNIALPYSINEFYVNNNNDKFEKTLENNREEFDNICKAINDLNTLFKQIIKNFEDIPSKSGDFEYITHNLKLIFTPYEGQPIYGKQVFLSKEDISKLLFVRKITRYEYGTVRGKWGKKEIQRHAYETNIDSDNGKEKRGAECYKGFEWVSKNWLIYMSFKYILIHIKIL